MVEAERHNAAYDDPDWRRKSRAAVTRHRRKHGDWCPGYLVAPHRSTDLTASHPIALATGGPLLQEPIVECRACNSRRGTRAVA